MLKWRVFSSLKKWEKSSQKLYSVDSKWKREKDITKNYENRLKGFKYENASKLGKFVAIFTMCALTHYVRHYFMLLVIGGSIGTVVAS